MSDRELVLIRGLPGSGKSTLAIKKYVSKGYSHWESDMFFTTADGQYRYIKEQVPLAHQWCQANVRRDLAIGRPVVVSNTFTQHWEMDAYRDMAIRFKVPLQIFVCTGNYTNIHGCSAEHIERMRRRWQP